MFESLPENLVIEILSLLPVKSLLRLKSVNKSLYNVVKSPYFIFSHLKRNIDRHENCLIAQFVILPYCEFPNHMVWLDKKPDEANTILSIHDDDTTIRDFYDICGPCDGLYHLWSPWSSENRCLWNAALKEYKRIPRVIVKPSMPSNIDNQDAGCGFGFDPINVDYKVIVIQFHNDRNLIDNYAFYSESCVNYPLSVVIYSVRNDSWRYVDDLSKHYYICENSSHTFVNTSLYWLGSHDKNAFKYDVIIVVNLTTEAIEEIGLPEKSIKGSMITYESYSECLMVYHSSIALVAHYKDEGSFDIWTLKARSWSKGLSCRLDCLVRNTLGYYYLQENIVLFGGRGDLILYNLDLKESRVIPNINRKESYCKSVSTYMETLVPLNDQEFWVEWVKLRAANGKNGHPLVT